MGRTGPAGPSTPPWSASPTAPWSYSTP